MDGKEEAHRPNKNENLILVKTEFNDLFTIRISGTGEFPECKFSAARIW